jgi:hypothetical protein
MSKQRVKLKTTIAVGLSLYAKEILRKRPRFFAVVLFDAEAKFLVPDLGDVVDSGIGLAYRPAQAE